MSDQPALSKSELIVHIGTGKTGSSSIQKTLALQTDALNQQNAAYLGLMCENAPEGTKAYSWREMGGWTQFKSVVPDTAKREMIDVLTTSITQLTSVGINKAIWSNESLFSDGQFIVPILYELHKLGVKIKVIVYIRRHDTWARSAYLQWGIKHKTYEGPVKSFKEWHETHAINFSSGLMPWLNAKWIDLSVRNFDTCGDVVVDFINCSKLDVGNIEVLRENETPNPVALALWGIYNSQFEEPMLPTELQPTLQKSGLLGQTPIPCDYMSLLPTSADIENVVALAAEDRAFINKLFAENNQPEMSTDEPKKKNMAVSQEQINAALLMLVKHQNDRIGWLTRQVRLLKENSEKVERLARRARSAKSEMQPASPAKPASSENSEMTTQKGKVGKVETLGKT